MPSGPKRRKAAKKKKQYPPILHSSPTIHGNVSQNRYKLDSVAEARETDSHSSAFGAVVPVNCTHMEEESTNNKLGHFQKGEVPLDNGIVKEVSVRVTENSEHVEEIDIGYESSSSTSGSSEEDSKLEEKISEFVEEETLEEKQEEVAEDLLDLAVGESEKIEEKLSQSLDDCNRIALVGAEIVSNGMKGTNLAADVEEKNEESAGVVDLVTKGNVNDLLQKAVAVPAVEPRAIESRIPESTACQAAVSEHQNEPEIPESTGYQPPIIPVTRPTLHPTSWRSCCGLFDVLLVSDRQSDR